MLLLAAAGVDGYLQFMTVLILFVLVLALTYLVTRWISGYQKGRAGTGNLEVLETCRLAPNKYIQIVRAGKKYLVVAVGKDEIHMLSELSAGELDLKEKMDGQMMDFADIFNKVRKLKEKDKD